MIVLKGSLSRSFIQEVKREVEHYKSALKAKCDLLCRELGKIGVDTAVSIVPIDSGALRESITLEKGPGTSYVVLADSQYAAFVEFGTGVVGNGTYKYELPEGWTYLQDPPRSPWAHDPDDIAIWYYLGDDGSFHSTRGREGSGFMGGAADTMHAKVLEVAKEVFAR